MASEPQRLIDLDDQYKGILKLISGGMYDTAGSSADAQGREITGLTELASMLRNQYASGEQQDNVDLLSKFLPELQSLMARQTSGNRRTEMQDVVDLAPMVKAASDAGLGEDSVQLRDMLNKMAIGELGAGSQMDERMQRDLSNALRSSEVARGLSGSGSANREAVGRAMGGHQLLRDRQNFAQGVIGMNQGINKDPFTAILGNPNSNLNNAMGLFGQGAFQPKMAGVQSDPFATSFNLGTMAQNQQGVDLGKRQYDLQALLAKSQAKEYNVDMSDFEKFLL